MSERGIQRFLLVAFGLSGGAALLYEVVWTRALSLIFGSTVYALSTMLATFMAGLALGGYIGGRLADRDKNLIFYFGLFEVGIGVFGLMAVPAIYSLPPFYFKMHKALHLMPEAYFASQFAMSASIMLVPATLMGSTFPLVARRLTRHIGEMGSRVGRAYSINTMGAIFGSLSAGFLLVPALGLKWSSYAAGCVNIVAGCALILMSKAPMCGKVAAAAVLLPFAAYGPVLKAENDYPSANFYLAHRYESIEAMKEFEGLRVKLIEKDYREGNLRAYAQGDFLMLQQGGKPEGASPGDLIHMMRLAALPWAACENPGKVLVIGLGSGMTATTAALLANNVCVVEINPGVVEIIGEYGMPGLMDAIRVFKDDARKHLLVSETAYDIITSEPSLPTEAASANLYTKEFYELAASRLGADGVFCQGVQGWALTKDDLMVCLKTFASVFDHVYAWKVPGREVFTLLGSKRPFRFTPEEIVQRVRGCGLIPESQCKAQPLIVIATPERAREIVATEGIPLHTDDRPYLEFAMTKNLLLGEYFRKMR